MKKIIVTILITFISNLAFAQTEFVPDKNQVILENNVKVPFDFDEKNEIRRWKPKSPELKAVNYAILKFLNNAHSNENLTAFQKEEIKKILKQINHYRVQYLGVYIDGKKRIWCNFFPVPEDNSEDYLKFWKSEVVLVFDGGYYFWQIEYDVETQKCLNFISNGYA